MGGQSTRATQRLSLLGLPFTLHSYSHDPMAASYGTEAAAALGVPAGRVFKTLIASVDGRLIAAVVPVTGQLNLKALAAAVGGKKAEMAQTAAAERATGYVAGGISPVAQRKNLPLVLDSSALGHQTVFCSAGQRGLELELAPDDLVLATGATIADIARPLPAAGAGPRSRQLQLRLPVLAITALLAVAALMYSRQVEQLARQRNTELRPFPRCNQPTTARGPRGRHSSSQGPTTSPADRPRRQQGAHEVAIAAARGPRCCRDETLRGMRARRGPGRPR